MLALVTARLENLRTTSAGGFTCDPYSIYLLERACCEAEEREEESDRLEAAYLSQLRDSLIAEQQHGVGSKRGSRTLPSLWNESSLPTRPEMSAGWAQQGKRQLPESGIHSKREGRQDHPSLPELSAWARAAAEQEVQRYSAAKRRRQFWANATVDTEGLCSLTLG